MDLVSIAPATKAVALGSAAVVVSGLSLRKLTRLVSDYPALLSFYGPNGLDLAALAPMGSDVALAIFAAGVVGAVKPRWGRAPSISSDDLLAMFEAAPAGQQIDICATIVELTLKGQSGAPFLLSAIASLGACRNPPPQPDPMTPTQDASTPTSSSD